MAKPLGEARPAWKVLRVLGNLFEQKGFEQVSSEEVLKELQGIVGETHGDNRYSGNRPVTAVAPVKGFFRAAETPMYSVDALVRRAAPLQETRDADALWAHLSPDDAKRLKVVAGDKLSLRRDGARLTLPVKLDESIAVGEVWVPAALAATLNLGPMFSAVELEKA